VVPCGSGLLLGGDDHVPRPWREAVEALAQVELAGLAGSRDEALLGRLLADAHAAPDVGPRGARAPGLVDEVPDEVVGHVAQVLGREHRVGELVEGVGVDGADDLDEVVEADRGGGAGGRCHTSTIR
jgi:hypothetical protein